MVSHGADYKGVRIWRCTVCKLYANALRLQVHPTRERGNGDDLIAFIDSKLTNYSVEMREELRGEIALALLSKQGFQLVGQDFLQYQGEADRFVMNPPFENLQDIDHVRHAYELLRSGGRVVSVMSQSTFFQSRAKAQDFRQWFASRGEILEELPRGTFGIADTQVSSKLVKLTA
jgi:hypothetical protein